MADITFTQTLRKPVSLLGGRNILKKIAHHILGTQYTLSVVFIGDKKSQTLNQTYRKKDKPTNVLAFPLTPHEGEIFINVPKAHAEAKRFKRTPAKHLLYLFIHACLHLKGYRHGATMETAEQELCSRFNV